MAVIETDGLTKLYGKARGIEDVTFSVEAGEVFGFLGPNGAGKTTTIRTLLDLLHPTRGSARVFGLDSHRDSVAIRARLGNLPGDFGYGRQASGREALRLLARLRGIDGAGRAEALAERFRADLDRPLGQLSRGNRQKVGLILATFHSPELLILDEPTSGLDPLMQEEFLALVAEERERGCTVLLSSHELDEVERVCDRVGIVRERAKLIAVERIADLLGKARRRVTVELADPSELAELRALPGVGDLGSRTTASASGRRRPRRGGQGARRAPRPRPRGRPPTLEEVFLSYYEEARDDRAGDRARRRPPLATGAARCSPGGCRSACWSAFIVAIFPSVEEALSKAVQSYPPALKEAFGIGELTNVEQYLHAEMLSLIVPLALGYLAVRAVASGLSGAAESGRLDVLLSAPVSRRRLARGELRRHRGRARGRARASPSLLTAARQPRLRRRPRRSAPPLAGFANVWPLALLFAGLGIVATGFSLRTSVVTGSVAGVLVAMYVIDLVGRLDPDLSGVRYVSVFKYYGNAIEDGIDPLAFCGVTAVAIALAAARRLAVRAARPRRLTRADRCR